MNTPLHLAAHHGSTAIVQLLLKHKADPSIQNRSGDIPLHMAVKQANEEIVETLLQDPKEQLEIRNGEGQTPLFTAVDGVYGNDEETQVIVHLLDKKANINAKDNNGKSPLQQAADNRFNDIVQLLLSNKADPTLRNDENKDIRQLLGIQA